MRPFKLVLFAFATTYAADQFVLEGYSYRSLDSLYFSNCPQFRSDSLGLEIKRTQLESANYLVSILPTVNGSYSFRPDVTDHEAYSFVVPPGPSVRVSWNLNQIYTDLKARETASLAYQQSRSENDFKRTVSLSDFRTLCLSYFTKLKNYRNLLSQVEILTKIVETAKENLQNNLVQPVDFFSYQLRLLQLQADADQGRGEVVKLEVKICALCGVKYAP